MCLNVFYFCKKNLNIENPRFFMKSANKIRFLINFQNPRHFFMKSANFFVFVLKCTQREHVHNWNRRLARSALKVSYIYIFIFCKNSKRVYCTLRCRRQITFLINFFKICLTRNFFLLYYIHAYLCKNIYINIFYFISTFSISGNSNASMCILIEHSSFVG